MSMVHIPRAPLAIALSLVVAGSAVLADEPGPGGTKVPKPVTGAQVYEAVCQACHMPDGKGATGAATIPALAKNPSMGSSEYLLTLITAGRGAMPPLGRLLSPAQIAAVATHVRTHFGNNYRPPVSEAEVTKFMAAQR